MQDAVGVQVGDALQELVHVAAYQIQRQSHAIFIKELLEVLHRNTIIIIIESNLEV